MKVTIFYYQNGYLMKWEDCNVLLAWIKGFYWIFSGGRNIPNREYEVI